jgi:ornithine cyclodeaminase
MSAGSPVILNKTEIENRVQQLDIVPLIGEAFAAFSRGEAVVPLPGELIFGNPPGETHIKYGYFTQGETYVIKIASGFFENPARGLNTSDGLMLVFSKQTGELGAILNDRGRLTDLRTAAAGAVAAHYMAPEAIDMIGVIGTGMQAELQVDLLQKVRPCKNLIVWGRRTEQAQLYAQRMTAKGYQVVVADTPAAVAQQARLIVTTTASHEAILTADMIQKGTHITAIGADTPEKQELEAALIHKADIVATDSRAQACHRGELYHAFGNTVLSADTVFELGELVAGQHTGRSSDKDITIATLTGLAVQDIAIATAVLNARN